MNYIRDPGTRERLTYTFLSSIFVLGIGLYSLQFATVTLTPLLWAQLAFAVYRISRMISYDKVFETYRMYFVEAVPDPTGEGDTTQARGTGIRRAFGELICCPVCAGTWVAAGLMVGLTILPNFTLLAVNIFSIIGLAELLNAATEFLQWLGQWGRESAGTQGLAKRAARSSASLPEDGRISAVHKNEQFTDVTKR